MVEKGRDMERRGEEETGRTREAVGWIAGSSASEVDEDIEYDEVDQDDDGGFVPSPLVPLKEQIEKDKEDESLRRWKEKLLGPVALDDQSNPEVKFHSIGIVSGGSEKITTPLPVSKSLKDQVLFSLAEGSKYQLKLTFTVLHNIVSGLTYSNSVWKGGLQVDQSKGMLGTFAPHKEPYIYQLEEETTPSGLLARGIYSAKLKFEDDDRRTHMELDYKFEIRKNW
ncbi:unnamed protein product [Rhodiola kirilowii]